MYCLYRFGGDNSHFFSKKQHFPDFRRSFTYLHEKEAVLGKKISSSEHFFRVVLKSFIIVTFSRKKTRFFFRFSSFIYVFSWKRRRSGKRNLNFGTFFFHNRFFRFIVTFMNFDYQVSHLMYLKHYTLWDLCPHNFLRFYAAYGSHFCLS